MISLAISFVNMCIGRNGGAAQGQTAPTYVPTYYFIGF